MGNELSSIVDDAKSRPSHLEVVHTIPWLDTQTAHLVHSVTTHLARELPGVLAVILFGSLARHEERPLSDQQPSDIDLLVITEEELTEQLALAIHRCIGEVERNFDERARAVQALLIDRALSGWDLLFIENVARDGILLWARGPLPAPLMATVERAVSLPRLA